MQVRQNLRCLQITGRAVQKCVLPYHRGSTASTPSSFATSQAVCAGKPRTAAKLGLSAVFQAQAQPQRSRTSVVMAATGTRLAGDVFFLDEFAIRQWDDPNYSGTRISFDKATFVEKIHQLYAEGGDKLIDGYAPFCKHVIVPNFIGARVGCLEITDANRGLLQCAYTRRRADELPVLTRWFPEAQVEVPESKMLDVILYSREQLVQEYRSRQELKGLTPEDPDLPPAPWGIISIKAQDEDFETPMQPITMMRNALGKAEGGSGVPLDREKYEESAAYWETHAPIVAGDRPSGE